MSEKPIQNCEVRFQFQCPKQWEALQETSEEGVRSCSQCQKQVYLCESKQEAVRHAREGHCIAMPAWVLSPQDFPDDFERVEAVARQHGVHAIRLRGYKPERSLRLLVPIEVARKHCLIPMSLAKNSLTVAMSDPANLNAIDDLKFLTGHQVEVVVASPREIEEALDRAEREDPIGGLLGVAVCDDVPEPEPELPQTPVTRIILGILNNAHSRGVDQIRFESMDSHLVVRYGVAGTLQEVMRPPLKLRDEFLHQLRLLSGAGLGNEGQLQIHVGTRLVHFQVLITPAASGEDVVIQPLPEKRPAR